MSAPLSRTIGQMSAALTRQVEPRLTTAQRRFPYRKDCSEFFRIPFGILFAIWVSYWTTSRAQPIRRSRKNRHATPSTPFSLQGSAHRSC